MTGERFKKQEPGSFFGDFIYDRVVPSEHFLRQLQAVVTWPRFTKRLVRFRLRRGQGPAGAPALRPGGAAEDAAGGLPVQPL